MSDWAVDILKSYGLAGVVIVALGLTVIYLYRSNVAQSAARLADNDRLHKLAADTTTALDKVARASEERNLITEELAASIDSQGIAYTRLADRVEFHQSQVKDEVQRHGLVISAVSQAVQVMAGTLRDVQTALERMRGVP